ncbi:MAG: phosphoenolpyruvate--protein phosphotransferase [Lentisphaeria bacterium]
MAKGTVELIFSVAELVRLFDHSKDLSQFLHRVVETIASHLQADVCSVYLLEERQEELVLTATVGLAQESVGDVRLSVGEGITGLAVKEKRALREARGEDNPAFKFFQGIKEEEYQAFIAVPIFRGAEAVGALTVQHRQPGYFTDEDEKILTAIAAQLASTIENTRLLLRIDRRQTMPREAGEGVDEAQECPSFIKAAAASRGVCQGKATFLTGDDNDSLEEFVRAADNRTLTVNDFEVALKQTKEQIRELEQMLEEKLDEDSAAMIFSAHQLILTDDGFSGYIRRLIEEEGATPARAILQVVEEYGRLFADNTNPVLREKTQDIRDLGYRLLRNLLKEHPTARDYEGCIIIARELLPSDILKLSAQGAAGVILLSGSMTSHVSILLQAIHLPLVIVSDTRILTVPDGIEILLDAAQGTVFIEPDDEVLSKYEELRKAEQTVAEQETEVLPATYTADGIRINLYANINLCSDLANARRLKAEGIGLYRSEFPFIIRNDFPSEEEQLKVYKRILDEMEGLPVTFRTLDIGGDKVVSYVTKPEENNPFMGLRAIRFSLKNKGIFANQLRALLRAAAGKDLAVMFPMIASLDDFLASRNFLFQCKAELAETGTDYCEGRIDVGAMIELPSAVNMIEELAEEADFLSIGSNDLIQYLLAVDRTNEDIQDFYKPFHPAVLRVLKRIVEVADAKGVPVSLCGEIATDERMLPFLLGIGLRKFSMDAHHLPRVQRFIGEISSGQAEHIASQMLSCRLIKEIEEVMDFSL